ncbi:MAG: dihydrolipoyl dehydrogenase [Burkholderiales bacterium]|nr:dihydrolipoyl dehydrogenase [Burkholderiales bacterium]
MALIELKVPDIGDFDEVEVIELLVAAGDAVKLEQSLLTVESEKASMEIPSSATGRIVELKVGLGDKVAQGSVIALVETVADVADLADVAEVTQSAPPAAAASVSATDVAPIAPLAAERVSGSAPAAAGAYAGQVDLSCRLLVLGAGPGGYSAAFRAADLGLDTILVERYPTLGGVCLNVGCIPSKALLHTAAVIDEARALAAHGITFGEPRIDLDALRASKDKVVSKLTQGLAGMARARKVRVIRGYGRFIDAHHLEVETTEGDGQTRTGARQVIRFEQAIIAAGSQSVRLPFLPDDPRIVDSTGALKLATRPGRMLVIGGGIIGLEMGTVYSTLGARLDVVEMLDGLMQGADRDLVKVWQRHNGHRFDRIMLKTRTVRAEATPQGIMVWFEGDQAPAEPQCYDLVLSAVGRRPNGLSIGADAAGVTIGERGFIAVDKQMRTNVSHIFAIGDIVGQPMLAHKAVHEGHVAAEAAAGEKSYFDARVIPSVAYTDPEIAWVGLTEEQAGAQGLKIAKSTFPWSASGRAIANGRDEGFTKLIFDQASHRLLGGAIVGTHAGDMIGELALAIEMGADATDIGRTIHPHPTLGETIGMAAELFEGVCTDLPPASRRH